MKLFFLLLLLLPLFVSAQFNEQWSYSDFSEQNNWSGDIEKFACFQPYQLQLNAEAETSEALISRPCTAINNGNWQFSLSMAFNPSSSNYIKVFLVNNQANLSNATKGYYVMIGNTADEISLWKTNEGSDTKIIDGVDKSITENINDISIQVQRDEIGNWILDATVNGNTQPRQTVFDDEIQASNYFGLYCKYTSTRSNKMLFETINVSGDAFVDDTKPIVISNELLNGRTMKLTFSEAIESTSVIKEQIVLPSNNSISSYRVNGNELLLNFNTYLSDAEGGLISISGVQDLYGNVMDAAQVTYIYNRIKVNSIDVLTHNSIQIFFSADCNVKQVPIIIAEGISYSGVFDSDSSLLLNSTIPFESGKNYSFSLRGVFNSNGDEIATTDIEFVYHRAKRYDLVINEIMTDPSPIIGLPEEEYIEIYNASGIDYNLKDWYLIVNGKRVLLPDSIIKSKDYALIADKDGLYANTPKLIALPTMPSLTNSSGEIVLCDRAHVIIDAIKYPFGAEPDNFKKDGGWSFERVDVNNFQNYGDNWQYSVNLEGGTPGNSNSIVDANIDSELPHIKNIACVNDSIYEISFSEAMDWSQLAGLNFPALAISTIQQDSIFLDKLTVAFAEPLEQNVIEEFYFEDIPKDLNKNPLIENYKLRIGAPSNADSLDVLINEILFNPLSEGVDYLELYNNSDKIIDLDSLRLCGLGDGGLPEKLLPVFTESRLFFPREHIVISTNALWIKEEYNNVITELSVESSLPSLPDDVGDIAVCSTKGAVLDILHYTDEMQFALLSSGEGVALERISYSAPTNQVNNWHSASSQSGFGTPTQPNSQMLQKVNSEEDEWIWLTAQEFSPNSDGYQDVLQVNYALSESGWMGSIVVYDKVGRLIKTLLSADLLASSGFVTWDGTDVNNNKATLGIYIIYAHFYHANGMVKQNKLSAVRTAGSR